MPYNILIVEDEEHWAMAHKDVAEKQEYWNAMMTKQSPEPYATQFSELIEKFKANGIDTKCIPQFAGNDASNFFDELAQNLIVEDFNKEGYLLYRSAETEDNCKTPFHQWFCEAASCFRGHEVYKGAPLS